MLPPNIFYLNGIHYLLFVPGLGLPLQNLKKQKNPRVLHGFLVVMLKWSRGRYLLSWGPDLEYFFHLAFWGCWEKMIIFHYVEAKFPVYTTQCAIPSTMWWKQFKKKILIYSIWTSSKNTCRILSFATPCRSYFFYVNVACSYMHFCIFYLKKYLIIFYNYVLYYRYMGFLERHGTWVRIHRFLLELDII